jgi:S-DNA-T family DNA segregation ATPase FtsK/SpoIIIE
VTRYEAELEAGVKLNKLTSLSGYDIALSLGRQRRQDSAPIPNKISTVGNRGANKIRGSVNLRDIIDTPEFRNSSSKLTFALGKNISGEAIIGNLARLPHILVAAPPDPENPICLNYAAHKHPVQGAAGRGEAYTHRPKM